MIMRNFLFKIFFLSSVLLSSLLAFNFSRDAHLYRAALQRFDIFDLNLFFLQLHSLELFFAIVSSAVLYLHLNFYFVFLAYSLISIYLKFKLIMTESTMPFLSFLVFFSFFFWLHDSTQIRASLGVAASYWALLFFSRERIRLSLGIIFFSSIFFHMSSLIMLVMFVLKRRQAFYYILALVVPVFILQVFGVGFSDFISFVLSALPSELPGIYKLNIYLNSTDNHVVAPLINPLILSVLLLVFLLGLNFPEDRVFSILNANLLVLSVFFYYMFADIPVLQSRIGEFLGFSLVFVIPYIYYNIAASLSKNFAFYIITAGSAFWASYLIIYKELFSAGV